MSGLRFDAVHKRYRAVRALDAVSLRVERGRVVRLIGPNGAGKSTLLRVAAGLTRPTRGHVHWLERDVFGGERAALRSEVGYLGMEYGLYGELSLRENLEFGVRMRALEAAEIERWIKTLALEDVAERPVRTLSLGYRRRAGLARSLLGDPPLLLLDEPWNGLDTESMERLAAVLQGRRGDGVTALIAAHGADAPSQLFDAEVEIRAGQLGRVAGQGVEAVS